jgi:hypothetical protein
VSVLTLLGTSALAEARRGLRAGEQIRAQLLALAGGAGMVRVHQERSWASINFAGSRHTLQLRFDGDDIDRGEAMIGALPDHEFVIPGQLVAEANVLEFSRKLLPAPNLTVTVEVLLLEEG